jgi:O-antigen/teichoic acid export membrane protein
VIARVAQVSTRLVTVPIVIVHLGLGGYGIWSIIMTSAAYMRFGSIGIKSAFQKYVAEATGNGEFETVNQLLSTGCAAMCVLSVVGLIPIALFSSQLAQICGVPSGFMHSASRAISVLALIMVMSNVGSVYEAIVMGGHRIDLTRNFATFFTLAEAVAIVSVLHFGLGLFAMASVMAISEIGFVLCCYFASKRVMPQVRIGRRFVTKRVIPELLRFAGSYQLVNVLEVLYGAILPVTVLRVFGANAAGVYAVTTRLVLSAMVLSEALLLPILSGSAMVHASGEVEEMRRLIGKSVKVTWGLTLFPLAFIAAFGPKLLFAWIGQTDSSFRVALWLACSAGFFQAFSVLGLVLYRSSGKALFDNLRQVLRILTLLLVAVFAHDLGFYGLLSGLALAEFVGMGLMLFAVA